MSPPHQGGEFSLSGFPIDFMRQAGSENVLVGLGGFDRGVREPREGGTIRKERGIHHEPIQKLTLPSLPFLSHPISIESNPSLLSLLPSPSLPFCPLPSTPQVTRALKIKSQYLSQTSVDLASKRKAAEQDIDSGILGLGLLRAEGQAAEKGL